MRHRIRNECLRFISFLHTIHGFPQETDSNVRQKQTSRKNEAKNNKANPELLKITNECGGLDL